VNRRENRQQPHFDSVNVEVGLGWHGGMPYIFEEKIDGFYCEADSNGLYFKNSKAALPSQLPEWLRDVRLVGELKEGTLHVFDIIHKGNTPLWKLPLNARLPFLERAQAHFPSWMKPIRRGNGGEFLEAILAEGGEGIVAKHRGGFFGKMGAWVKCKRSETHDLRVISFDQEKMSVELENGRGRCKVSQPVNVGAIIEVSCHSIHKSGKLREPVFVRSRPDKD
jgi:ATP-dependent DNA ligase